MESRGFRINLLGTSFTITTDEDGAYLDRIIARYSEKIEEIEKTGSTRDPLRIAILAGILVTDDLFRRTEGRVARENDTLGESIARSMIARIDSILED